jgi:hypothetical protein
MFVNDNAVQFPANVTGVIRLICPITVVNLDGVRPSLAFYSTDDNSGNSVSVFIRRMTKNTTGSLITVCSGSSADTGGQLTIISPSSQCFASALDTDGFIYYALIQLQRTNTSGTLTFRAVELF